MLLEDTMQGVFSGMG